ncbi:MAG: YceI family protein [Flavobacteriales bacterium]|nr:YceI family protein [Flavobacteriales bacterium]
MKTILLIASLPVFLFANLAGTRTLTNTTSSSVTILGSSNVHDWESKSVKLIVNGKVEMDEQNNELIGVNEFTLEVPVKTILSPKGSIMDNKTWEALKYEKYPKIIFNLTRVVSFNKVGTSSYALKVQGNLKIAGVSKLIYLDVTGQTSGRDIVKFQTSKDLKMSDFGITPPTAFFGAMTTSNEITLKFDLTLKHS